MTDESEWDDYDTELEPEDVLGTRTFEDVLYTGEHGPTAEEAAAHAREGSDTMDAPLIAVPASREQRFEVGGAYNRSAFFTHNVTGGLNWHTAYRAAYELDAFDVEFDADYETGDLTITVERAGE